jgi:hypothetical protein
MMSDKYGDTDELRAPCWRASRSEERLDPYWLIIAP